MCDFCKIINKELNANIVCETSECVAFLDYAPINKGHVLICPRKHASSIVDMTDETLMDINAIVRKLVKVYEKEYGAKSYTIMQNGGECCDYGHFHFHVFPRYDGDGFGYTQSDAKHEYSKEVSDFLGKKMLEV